MEKIAGMSFMDINMLEIFSYSFMIRALIAGGIIGVIAPLIGSFLVAKRYSLMADSLAHVSLAGVAVGLLLNVSPVLTAVIVSTITALVIERLRSQRGISGETALAMFLSGGLAIAIVLIGLGKGLSVDLFSYLFGSITTVTSTDIWIVASLGLLVLAITAALYRQLLYIAFDEEAAQVSGVPVSLINSLLIVMTAITVSIAMRIVGVLLIGALMVIPVVAATQFKRSFLLTILIAVGISLTSVGGGLLLAYYFDLAAGGTIVVWSLIIFGLVAITKK